MFISEVLCVWCEQVLLLWFCNPINNYLLILFICFQPYIKQLQCRAVIPWSIFSKILITDTPGWGLGVFCELKIWFMFWCRHCIAVCNIMISLGFNGTGLYFAPKQIADATLVVLINTVLTCAACMTRAAVKGYLEANTISSEHSACGNQSQNARTNWEADSKMGFIWLVYPICQIKTSSIKSLIKAVVILF